jgi:chromosome segregation protein
LVWAAPAGPAAPAGALHEAELGFRAAEQDRSAAEHRFRAAVDQEAAAREALASEAARTARLDAVEHELRQAEEALGRVQGELAVAEGEREEAESAFRIAEQERREAEDARRRAGEEAATRRAEAETLKGSLASAERERDRLEASLAEALGRATEHSAELARLEAEIERLDGQSSPLGDRRSTLEEERRRLVELIEELEEAFRRMEARRELLEARRLDIEETAGSRFLRSHPKRSAGLLRDLVRAEPGYERALAAALGALADAVVYDDGERALADASDGDGAVLAISAGGPVPLGLAGERGLLTAVEAEPVARGIVSTALRDVYLADSVEEAAAKQARHPRASFVTPQGVLVGPSVIHTAREADARVREIRAELQVLEHDLAATRGKLKPRRSRLDEIAGELAFLQEQMEAADAEITAAAELMSVLERELAGAGKEQEVLRQRIAAVDDAVGGWRGRLDAVPPPPHELPTLPPFPQQPIQARVAVEALRRERGQLDERLGALRSERQELAATDPTRLRAELAEAEEARAETEGALGGAEEAFVRASAARSEAAEAERAVAEREAAVNRAWREASTELDRLREAYEEDDRLRGDIERRIRDAERLIREGHGADPGQLVASLGEDEGVESLEKRAELVQRRLALLGRVNLLASGEFEALQERHDFMLRELEDVRKARRDLLEVIAQVDRQIAESFAAAYDDVSAQFERLVGELFPGGQGRLVLTDPANPLEAGIEIEASPGRKRVRRISLLSGGERSLTALAFLFAIFTARPSPFYLMDEVEPALDDVNLHRFLRLVEGFAADAQVLIVTHQKRTMEVAGMMYGVSLAADGTTKVVCQRLEGSLAKARDAARKEAEREEAEAAAARVPQAEPVG